MFILERLTSSSCRSLAAMIGFARSAGGARRRGGQSGTPDDWRSLASQVRRASLCRFQFPDFLRQIAAAPARAPISLQGATTWTVDIS
jgi:hypothetical protein